MRLAQVCYGTELLIDLLICLFLQGNASRRSFVSGLYKGINILNLVSLVFEWNMVWVFSFPLRGYKARRTNCSGQAVG